MTQGEITLYAVIGCVVAIYFAIMLDVPERATKLFRRIMDRIWWHKINRDYKRWYPDED